MSNDKNDPSRPADPLSGRRPYATLDLKATEIKVTTLGDRSAAPQPAPRSTTNVTTESTQPTPKPAPAWVYDTTQSMGDAMAGKVQSTASVQSTAAAAESTSSTASVSASSRPARSSTAETSPATMQADKVQTQSSDRTGAKPAAKANSTTDAPAKEPPPIVIKRNGGFFSHLAAGLAGGALAFAGLFALPGLGFKSDTGEQAGFGELVSARIAAMEKKFSNNDLAAKLQTAETRLAALEKSSEQLAGLKDSQMRFIAETKAALAASASDTGATEQLTRILAIEEKMKALADAGANDPNAGRLAQLAALTGKVADLETALQTQLTALRKSVSDDVDARIATVSAAAEAAKSGTQRIDKEIANLQGETTRLGERMQSAKTDADKFGENLKIAHEEAAAIKSALDAVKSSTAKPADVTAAITPVGQKLATLEERVAAILKAEDDRRSNAERVVLSLELQNLKRVLDRGQKYDAELGEVQKAAAGKVDLSALAKFKDEGVPTVADLSRDFRLAGNAAIDADSEPADGSVVGRLIAGAKSVVRVRKVSHNADDKGTEAVVGRMEVAMKEGRLGDVLEFGKALNDKARDAAKPFLDKVAARHSVDGALAALESQIKSSFGAAPGEPKKSVQ